jgi:HEAT repeats/Putative zinc-finger
MNCERVKELFADYLVGCLDETARAEVDSHLTACASCREESRSLQAIWTKLALLPKEAPSAALDARFHALLEAYRQGMKQAERDASKRVTLRDWLARMWPREPALQLAVAVVLFAAGLLLGPSLTKHRQNHATDYGINNRALAQLRDEVASMKQLVTLSLLQQQSASDRLRGVEWSYRLAQPDEQVLSALLRALDSDPNVNVRLAAVDALHQFGTDDTVRKGLLHSLAEQRSPLVQFELINLMVELKEKGSVPMLKELSQRQDLDPTVRERAEWGLQKLG